MRVLYILILLCAQTGELIAQTSRFGLELGWSINSLQNCSDITLPLEPIDRSELLSRRLRPSLGVAYGREFTDRISATATLKSSWYTYCYGLPWGSTSLPDESLIERLEARNFFAATLRTATFKSDFVFTEAQILLNYRIGETKDGESTITADFGYSLGYLGYAKNNLYLTYSNGYEHNTSLDFLSDDSSKMLHKLYFGISVDIPRRENIVRISPHLAVAASSLYKDQYIRPQVLGLSLSYFFTTL